MVESYSAELSSAGFWPGGGEEGAYYAYMYPERPGYREAAVPAEAFYDERLGEFLLPYGAVRLSSRRPWRRTSSPRPSRPRARPAVGRTDTGPRCLEDETSTVTR